MRRSSRNYFVALLLSISSLCFFISPAVPAPGARWTQKRSSRPQKGSAETSTADGLNITTFTTPQGKIRVYLPDDMAAGDTISGTVSEEPGSTGELNGYVVEMEKQRASVSGKTFKWTIPATFTGKALSLILRNQSGNEVAMSEITISTNRAATGRPQNPTPNDFQLPTIGQAGRAMQVRGPFDGDFATTNIKVGGNNAVLLAESPRKVVAESPKNAMGPTEIECQEHGTTAKGPHRILDISLSAKTNLQRGEQTELKVVVVGLQGLKTPVQVKLEDRSPSVVSMSGGNMQNFNINPADVQGDTYSTQRTLTALQRGNFNIIAIATGTEQSVENVASGPTVSGGPTPEISKKTTTKSVDGEVCTWTLYDSYPASDFKRADPSDRKSLETRSESGKQGYIDVSYHCVVTGTYTFTVLMDNGDTEVVTVTCK